MLKREKNNQCVGVSLLYDENTLSRDLKESEGGNGYWRKHIPWTTRAKAVSLPFTA